MAQHPPALTVLAPATKDTRKRPPMIKPGINLAYSPRARVFSQKYLVVTVARPVGLAFPCFRSVSPLEPVINFRCSQRIRLIYRSQHIQKSFRIAQVSKSVSCSRVFMSIKVAHKNAEGLFWDSVDRSLDGFQQGPRARLARSIPRSLPILSSRYSMHNTH